MAPLGAAAELYAKEADLLKPLPSADLVKDAAVLSEAAALDAAALAELGKALAAMK